MSTRRHDFLILTLLLAGAATVGAAACDKKQPAAGGHPGADPQPTFGLADALKGLDGDGKLMAEITVPQGTILCELFPEQAPETVASFVGLARGLRAWKDPKTGEWIKGQPFFDGLAFHRVIPAFMIQGGDPLSRNYDDQFIGTGGPGYKLPDEVKVEFDVPGRLAMANGMRPGTAGSQFFITEAPRPSLNRGFTVFGQCENPEVVRAVARVPRNADDKPDSPVTMTVKIYRR
jgi:peptidyl-prolyl cis-trans isomerase A (cyclophilin A)